MKIKRVGRKAMCLLLTLCFVFPFASAAPATGDTTVYATDISGTQYTSYQAAWAAARKGTTITLMTDWVIGGYLELGENETAKVNMNGHMIKRGNTSYVSDGGVILLDEGANLTLAGCDLNGQDKKRTFTYQVPDFADPVDTEKVGGLITGGMSEDGGGGILMQDGAWLTLDNVAVAGNYVEKYTGDLMVNISGGGVCMDGDNCRLYMVNGACIDRNVTCAFGGGVFINGDNCVVSLKGNSRIWYNYAQSDGGGIYSDNSGTTIVLEEGSTINSNISEYEGAGIFLNDTDFSVRSDDNTGKIINNRSLNDDGGAIYVDSVTYAGSGSISGLEMYNNYALGDGGAIVLNQENVTVKNCKFTDNTAKSEGGAIYIENDYCTIDGCTISGNTAAEAGGGIFSSSANNFALRGKVIVENNTRSDGSMDDVYLNQAGIWFMTSTSYLNGAPSAGSWVGIRTDEDDDARQIGMNAVYPENVFFSDVAGWHLEASGNELWLKKGTRYTLTVNSEHLGCFEAGKTVTINGTPDDSKVFRQWNDEKDVTYADPTAMITTIVMPERDVELTASYVEKTYQFTLNVPAPVAGQPLAAKGTITWQNAAGNNISTQRDVIWLEEADGKTQTVSGKAEYGKTYSVAVVLEQNLSGSIAFDESVKAKVAYTDSEGTGTPEAAYRAKVDDAGALRIYGKPVSTEKAKVIAVDPVCVTVGINSNPQTLPDILPETVVLTTKDGKQSVNVSYPENALADVDLTKAGTYSVKANIDYTSLNLNPNGFTTATIGIQVRSDGVLNAPTANTASGTYTAADTEVTVNKDQSISMQIDLRQTDENADGFSYTLISSYNTEDGLTGEQSSGTGSSVTLTAAKGQRVTFVLYVSSTAKGYDNSAAVSYIYVLDNPYTVTVHGIDTGLTTGGEAGELYEAKTYRYHTGDSVVIGAAAVDGELFEKWKDLKGISGECTDMTLKVTSITEDIELTAIYNPVVQELTLTMDAPETGKALPTEIRSASVSSEAYSAPYDAAGLFGSITWTPDADTAAGGISYMAALKVTTDDYAGSGMKIRISDNLAIRVTDPDGNPISVTAAAQVENGNQLTVYLTFPETAAEEPEPTPQPKPQPTPDTPEKPTTPDKGSEKPDYSDCPHDSTCPAWQYEDLDPKAWYHDGVHDCLDKGLMNGVSSTEFAPNATMTRAQLVTILWRMDGKQTVSQAVTFRDVPANAWYTEAIRWAAAEGIVEGYSEKTFGTNDAVTREQLAAILWRYAKYKGIDISAGKDTDIAAYTDAADISSYAVSAIAWAVSEGIITGTGSNTLSPRATATRAQTACMIQRFDQ